MARAPLHPGLYLRTVLEDRGISHSELRRRIGLSDFGMSMIVNGKRNISVEMALKLERALGIPVETLISMQNELDLWRARRELEYKLRLIQPFEMPAAAPAE
jgi:antitoxin HigA-1